MCWITYLKKQKVTRIIGLEKLHTTIQVMMWRKKYDRTTNKRNNKMGRRQQQ